MKWFWALESRNRVRQSQHEFMHSNGSLSLLFNWGNQLRTSHGSYSQEASLQSVSTDSRQVLISSGINAFGILFQPGGAYAVFGTPMQELSSIECLPGFGFHRLHEQLANTPGFADKVLKVESWLLAMLCNDYATSNIVPATLQLITETGGQASIRNITDQLSFSDRQIERAFKKEVGISPKKYAGLIRLQRARIALKQDNASLTEIAYRAGFYDQAHFCREFKKTIGLSPGDYLTRQNGF